MAVLHAPSTKYHLIDYERIVQELNAVMPKDMRLHAIKKVTRNFDCRHDAKCRRYNYLMPAFVFRGWEQIQGGTAQPMEEIEKLVGELN
jgi:tRNA pseudouridine(38-40) synthase